MKVYAPCFFRDFHCIGSDCRDNCCRMGWDIEIDQATYDRYKTLGGGLCEHITNENGEHYIMQRGGQCPFLNEQGLCSVLLEHGEDSISEICTQHPRFYEWFGGYKEAGTGLCCEESARLWLESAGKISFCEWATEEPDDDLEFDGELLGAVLKARGVLIGLLQSGEMTLSQKLKALLIFGLNTQEFDESGAAEDFYALAQEFEDIGNVKALIGQLGEGSFEDRLSACEKVLEYFSGLDYMKGVLPAAAAQIRGRLGDIIGAAKDFDKAFPQADGQLCAVAVYNVYRYFSHCARGAQCLPFIVTGILNVWFVRLWDILMWLDGKFDFRAQTDAVKEYSKEIEYSDNTAVLWEDVYTDSRLCAENLVKIAEV